MVAGDSGPADPDPCVGERNILAGFDLEIVVRTSQASEWVLAIFSGTLADLIDQVEGIVDAGGLKEGQANGLLRILSNVEKSLAKDKIGAACNQLQDFIDETENKVADGALEALDGADLVSTALGLRIFYEC